MTEAPLSRGNRLKIMFTAISCALTIVACGSASKPGSTTSGQSGSFLSLAVCMRSHGVPNFPDSPSSDPGGGVSPIPPGVNQSSPAFKTAWSACAKLLPGIGRHEQASSQAMAQMLKFSRCMRTHGVTRFPDPTPTPPANFSGYSGVVRRGGAYLAIPDTISKDSPVYKQAAAKCNFGPVFS